MKPDIMPFDKKLLKNTSVCLLVLLRVG